MPCPKLPRFEAGDVVTIADAQKPNYGKSGTVTHVVKGCLIAVEFEGNRIPLTYTESSLRPAARRPPLNLAAIIHG